MSKRTVWNREKELWEEDSINSRLWSGISNIYGRNIFKIRRDAYRKRLYERSKETEDTSSEAMSQYWDNEVHW